MQVRLPIVALLWIVIQLSGCSVASLEVLAACLPIGETVDGYSIYDKAGCASARARKAQCDRNPSLCHKPRRLKPKDHLANCESGDLESCADYADHLATAGDERDLPAVRDYRRRVCEDGVYPSTCRKYALMLYEGTGGSVDRHTARRLFSDTCGDTPFPECLAYVNMRRDGDAGPIETGPAIDGYYRHCDARQKAACRSLQEMGRLPDLLSDSRYVEIQELLCKSDEGAACVYLIENRPAQFIDDEAWRKQVVHYRSTACYHGYPEQCKPLWDDLETEDATFFGFIYLDKACEHLIEEACELLLAHEESYRLVQVATYSKAKWQKEHVHVWERRLETARSQ